jgi:3-mercaptopyruvate sulfurtransferase SseA
MLEPSDSLRSRLARYGCTDATFKRKNVIVLGDGFNDGSLASLALAQIGIEARVYLGGFEEWIERSDAPVKKQVRL